MKPKYFYTTHKFKKTTPLVEFFNLPEDKQTELLSNGDIEIICHGGGGGGNDINIPSGWTKIPKLKVVK